MDRKIREAFNTQTYDRACEWFVEFRTAVADAKTRSAFDTWVRSSPENLAAYLEVAAIWEEAPSLDPNQKWDAEKLIAQACESAGDVVSLPSSAAGSNAQPDPSGTLRGRIKPHRASPLLRSAVVLAAASVIIAGLIWVKSEREPVFRTEIGEQRSITLADRSIVAINSRSKVRIRYSSEERIVELLEGEALFNVSKDPLRPFIVKTDTTQVRAVGTQFDVDKKASGTTVSVVEGKVAILSKQDSDATGVGVERKHDVRSAVAKGSGPTQLVTSADAGAIYLAAGEQLTILPQSVQKIAHPNVSSATAWTQRRLVFDSASLSDVAEEFNRYNERQLLIDDPELYDFHISGVFSSSDPSSLIRFLRERPGVKVTESAAGIEVSKNNF